MHLSIEVDVCADVTECGVAKLFIMYKEYNLKQRLIQVYFVTKKQIRMEVCLRALANNQ